MLIENLMTWYLKRRYARALNLDRFEGLSVPAPRPDAPYLLYVHIPFCEELCPYCSFNRIPFDRPLAVRYFEALEKEIRFYAENDWDFSAVYVGGGTPTVLPDHMAELIARLRSWFSVREVSLETNPHHLTDPIMKSLREAGVNRLSVGVQSFDDRLLQRMERYHKYGGGAEIRGRLAEIMGLFDTVNLDMIFNFPTQTMAMLDRDLDILQDLQADQATFYPLMVSEITRAELARRFGPISYRQERSFYHRICDALQSNYRPGTAWCFSRSQGMIDEYIVDYDEYVGVGSGSFGYVDGSVRVNTFSVPEYIDRVNGGRVPLEGRKDFSPAERIEYDFMMKLFGITLDLTEMERKHGSAAMSRLWPKVAALRLMGAVRRDGETLRLTRKGQYYWVIMMREFFTGVNNFRDAARARIGSPQACSH